MEVQGAARFPGARGQIPNFVGAERAALHLAALPEWRRARAVKISAEAPQLPVRRLALRDRKTVYVALPRLAGPDCFVELDPGRLGAGALQAASLRGAERLGRRLRPEAVPRLDLVVCGAVAVNARGARVGQGRGVHDLEYGVLADGGQVDAGVPVITTVHGVQLLAEELPMEPHDVPVDVIVTPDGAIRLTAAYTRPAGVVRSALAPEVLAGLPGLRRLLEA
jgi:5-formyltetrahydrofolate cyclo-ligase